MVDTLKFVETGSEEGLLIIAVSIGINEDEHTWEPVHAVMSLTFLRNKHGKHRNRAASIAFVTPDGIKQWCGI